MGQRNYGHVKLTDAQKDKIVQLHRDEFITATDLAARYKCGNRTIAKILDAAGVRRGRSRRVEPPRAGA